MFYWQEESSPYSFFSPRATALWNRMGGSLNSPISTFQIKGQFLFFVFSYPHNLHFRATPLSTVALCLEKRPSLG